MKSSSSLHCLAYFVLFILCMSKAQMLSGSSNVVCKNDNECEGPLSCGIDNMCREECRGNTTHDHLCCSQAIEGFCREGEGDCDIDRECFGTLVCGNNNCGFDSTLDCCRQPEGDEGKNCTMDNECEGQFICGNDQKCREECRGQTGQDILGSDNSCCSRGIEGFCGEGEGDCDSDGECFGSLVCGNNNCDGPGFTSDYDCCRQPQGDEGKNCTVDNECSGPLVCGNSFVCRNPCTGSSECCTITGYCKEGEGDCDNDWECEGSLVCGDDNCNGQGFVSGNDCCEQPGGGGEIDPMDMPTTESSHSGTGTADGILSAPGVLLFAINFLMVLI